MRVVVLNTGSSSVKYQWIDLSDGSRQGGVVEHVSDHVAAVRTVIAELGDEPVDAVGHRVVHGGEAFTSPTRVSDAVLGQLRGLLALAPLHLPANIAGIEAAREHWPDIDHVAVFDTAFHRTIPPAAHRYGVPNHWYEQFQVRRYGFHGTSVAHVVGRAAEVLARPLDDLDLIVAHLGNGASITAVHAGRSVDTSMGMSPLEGLVMGTRSGDVDPSVISHVAAASDRSPTEVIGDLNRVCGLLGMAGTSDMRDVVERAGVGDPAAGLALDVFVHRVKRYIGAFLAVLGRCDAVVFTAGIGEHSAVVRARVCAGLERLGIGLDADLNAAGALVASPAGAPTAVLVIPTDEELEIARQTAAVLRPVRVNHPPVGADT